MTINNYHKKSINKNKNCIKHEPNNYSPNNKIKYLKIILNKKLIWSSYMKHIKKSNSYKIVILVT